MRVKPPPKRAASPRSAVVGLVLAIAIFLAPPPAEAVTVTSGHQHTGANTASCVSLIDSEAIRCFHQPHLLLTPGAGGADTVWLSANDGGEAVGQKLLSDGISHFTFFNGYHPLDLTTKLGGPGSFSSIDQLGGRYGTTYRQGKPFPVYAGPGSKKMLVLPKSGQATGGAIGPVEMVAFDNGNAGIWNAPLNSLLEFGPFRPTHVNAAGIFTGQLPNGDVGVGMPNGSGGVLLQDLGFPGNGVDITNANVITGHLDQGSRLIPFSYNLATNQVTQYKLPHDFRIGSLIGMSDTGRVAYGNAFKSQSALKRNQSVPVRWRDPNHPQELPGLYGKSSPLRGSEYGIVTKITDTGISVGAMSAKGRDVGFIDLPPPIGKLEGLEELALDLGGKARDVVAPDIFSLRQLFNQGKGKKACSKMKELGPALEEFADFLEAAVGFFAAEEIARFDDLSRGLHDLAVEIGCVPRHFPDASPTASQYPYDLPPVG